MFGGPIAHGMLSASLISTVIGTKLPGHGCIYISQNCRFKAPVRAGDTVRARATITEINSERRRVKLQTICSVGETIVVDGDAEVLVLSRKG
jgi:3-hydroxybutyryl-CoA dehydratase